MIKTQMIEALKEWRSPTAEEKEQVQKYYECYFDSLIRVCNGMSSILTVLGVVLCLLGQGAFLKAVGIVMFAIVFKLVWEKNESKRIKKLIQNGKFQVMSGHVCKLSNHVNSLDGYYVKAVSDKGENIDATFEVREKGLQMGTELLIVYISTDIVKGGFLRALTPYMRTAEGRKHTV